MPPILQSNKENTEHWISLSDIMTALMMVFLLISIVYMIRVQESVDIPRIFKADEQQLYSQLQQNLDTKLTKWGATLSPDLTVRFNDQDILFKMGSAELQPAFKQALDDIFPIYFREMMKDNHIENMKEIRIEGHTSSFWAHGVDANTAYIYNMNLSQQRAQNTLIYLLNSPKLNTIEKAWLKKKFRAIGYSSALTLDRSGQPAQFPQDEDARTSQRVEFRVVTNAEDKIRSVAYGD